jgi:hypothetical protein
VRRNRTKDDAAEVIMGLLVQVGGALIVLIAFALAQARLFTPQARLYLILNVVGASVLAVDASIERQWGFLLLEGVWAIIAAWGLARPASDVADLS